MSATQPQQNQRDSFLWHQRQSNQPPRHQPRRRDWTPVKEAATRTFKTGRDFWIKINNDWILNLAALLAYNLLMSIIPLLAMILSFFGLFLED